MENLKTNKDFNTNMSDFQSLNHNMQLNKLRTSLKVPLNKEKVPMMESIYNLKEKLNKKNYEKTRGIDDKNISLQKNFNSNAFVKSTESNYQNNTLENGCVNPYLNSNYETLSQEKNLSRSKNNYNVKNNSTKDITILNAYNNNYNHLKTNNKNLNNNLDNNINANSTANYFRNLTMKKFNVLCSNKLISKNKRIPKQEKSIRGKVFNNATGNKLSFRLNEKNEVNKELDSIFNKNISKTKTISNNLKSENNKKSKFHFIFLLNHTKF